MIVPVYNQGGSIVENVMEIRRRVAGELGDRFELLVVSDGSFDRTAERLLEARRAAVRVIHYDRNLGKGYAVKAGSLAARGTWVSYVDADLDLDPSALPRFLEIARTEKLDFAIGSKRHPESIVHYPRSRLVSSWLYQQFVRVLFQLDVRDTQVGLKVFRREVAEEVMPLLIVKQFAFDLELLAVARALGFGRIRELPVRLDYRFSGSGVRSLAVLRALIDTAAIFYRLRVLRYYQRKREVLGESALSRAFSYLPLVSLVTPAADLADTLDYPHLETVAIERDTSGARRAAAEKANGDVLALLAPGAVPAGNWVSGAVPFLARPEIAAVVCPTMAPDRGSNRERAAAAVSESRLGGGSYYFRFTPGNLRFVRDFPGGNLIVRRSDFLAVTDGEEVDENTLCARLHRRGRRIVYTPETVVVAPREPLFRPHLRAVRRYGAARARAMRTSGASALRVSTVALLTLPLLLLTASGLLVLGGLWRGVGAAAWLAYGALLGLSGLAAGIRYRSLSVGTMAAVGAGLTHAAYAAGFVRGLLSRAR